MEWKGRLNLLQGKVAGESGAVGLFLTATARVVFDSDEVARLGI
jgi:hypothetical protein